MSTSKVTSDASPVKTEEPLPDFAGIPDGVKRRKAVVDAYKYRAEEFRERYESMRTLEWNIILQTYAGYAAIALAFKYMQTRPFDQAAMTVLAVAVTFVLYVVSRYLTFHVQERLLMFDKIYGRYVSELDCVFHVPDHHELTTLLAGKYFWTYRSQLILSMTTFLVLLAYEGANYISFASLRGFEFFVLLAVSSVRIEWWLVSENLRVKDLLPTETMTTTKARL